MSPRAPLTHLQLFSFMCGLLWPAMLVDYNIRRVACSAVRSITASTTVTAMCLPRHFHLLCKYRPNGASNHSSGNCLPTVTASVLLIHYSSPWTGQAARDSTSTTYIVSLIPLFISLTRSIKNKGKSPMFTYLVHCRVSKVRLCSLVHFSAPGIDKPPCPLLILLFITVFN